MYTQRLFNRLMFLYFIQRKGWLSFAGDTNYLRALFRARDRDQALFVAAVNETLKLKLSGWVKIRRDIKAELTLETANENAARTIRGEMQENLGKLKKSLAGSKDNKLAAVLLAALNKATLKQDDDNVKGHLKSDIPRLKRRAVLLNEAILFSAISATISSFVVIVSFASAYLHVRHEYGVGLLFILSVAFFMASLINLARETRIALHEYDYFGGK